MLRDGYWDGHRFWRKSGLVDGCKYIIVFRGKDDPSGTRGFSYQVVLFVVVSDRGVVVVALGTYTQ